MNALAHEGFLLLAGPLAGSEHGRVRVLLIVNAEHEAEIHRRLDDDPWVPTEQIVTVGVEPWTIRVLVHRRLLVDPSGRPARACFAADGEEAHARAIR